MTPAGSSRRRLVVRPTLAALAALAAFALPALASDGEGEGEHEHENEIHVFQLLASTGVDVDAEAKAKWEEETDDGSTERQFKVEIRDLEAEGPFHLFVDDVDRGAFSAHENKLKIKFESGDEGGGEDPDGGDSEGEGEEGEGSHLPLDFDVLGAVLEVRDDLATVYFSDTFQPGGEASSSNGGKKKGAKLEIIMANGSFDADEETTGGPDANAKGKVKYEDKKDELRFEVHVEHLDIRPDPGAEPPTDPYQYDLMVGGEVVASFGGHHEIKVRFEDPFTAPGGGDSGEEDDEHFELKQELTFDPLGKSVEIVRTLADDSGAVVVLSAVLPETPAASAVKPPKRPGRDLGRSKADRLLIYLLNVGMVPGAKGDVVLEIRDDGEHEVEVEVEDLPDSTYDLAVDGVVLAEIDVTGGEGRVQLASDPGPGDVDLGLVDLRGALIEVRSGEDVVLSVVFPSSVPEALAKSKGDKEKFEKGTSVKVSLRRAMTNVATDLDATGDANWRYKSKGDRESLALRLTDLPVGTYELFVDDASVSPAPVLFDVSKGKASLKFDSAKAKPPKVLLLDFEVFGHTLKIGTPGQPAEPGVLIVTID